MTNDEVLMLADVLSRGKALEKDVIFLAIEAALATATRHLTREYIEVRVSIYQATGDYEACRQWGIVDDDVGLDSPTSQVTLADGNISYPDGAHEVGKFVEEALETVAKFGRIEAQAAKQVISQKVREAERSRIYEAFKDRVGEMVDPQFHLRMHAAGPGQVALGSLNMVFLCRLHQSNFRFVENNCLITIISMSVKAAAYFPE